MPDVGSITNTVVWAGFGLGMIFGFFANKTNFCTMGAISDVVNMGDWGRMRAWLMAIGIAILGRTCPGWRTSSAVWSSASA